MTTALEAMLPGDSGAMPAAPEKPSTPAPQEAEVKTTEQPAPQGGEPADDSIDVELGEGQRQRMVPKQALDEARGKVKRYTEQVASFEQQLKESNDAWERRLTTVLERFAPQQQQPAEPPKAPDWFENPDEALTHRLTQTVNPHFEQINRALMANSRLVAEARFQAEPGLVDEAEKAFITAMESRRLDPADYHNVVNSPNRYAAAVQWHKRQKAAAEIGDDPAAYRERLRAELLAELQQQPGGGAPQAPVMPSNLAGARNVGTRAGPKWAGPQPITSIFKE